ncbi:MAG: glycosyltransferase family 2 protein [Victivallales bacterium]|nr:glycosyltransferase family 2 protein [Victivallales bacterium]
MTPDITIVIPCYKVGNYLSQTLQSALAQTHRNIQVIAVDDCSPDDTAQIIRQFAARDSRLQGIFLGQNSGVSVARNAGLDSAKAPWVIFADGDDWLPANAVESLLEIQGRTKAQFVCANARQYTDAGKAGGIHFRRQAGLHQFSTRDSLDAFWPHQDVFCTCWAKLFSTAALRDRGLRFDSALRHAQDTLFTLTYLLSVQPTVAIDYDTEVYCYRQNPDSCVHAIPLAKRLNNLEMLIVALDDLALRTRQSRRLVAPKSAEYLWAIRKFAANAEECRQHAKTLISSELFREHLFPVLRQYGKFKHRMLARLLAAGHTSFLRFW